MCLSHFTLARAREIRKWFQRYSRQWSRGNSCGKVRECFFVASAICTRIHSAWINVVLLGLLCLVERWLSAHLSFRLKIIFMQSFSQSRFGFMSVWSCVKTALVTHLCRRWKGLLIALLTVWTHCYWAFQEALWCNSSKNDIITEYKLRHSEETSPGRAPNCIQVDAAQCWCSCLPNYIVPRHISKKQNLNIAYMWVNTEARFCKVSALKDTMSDSLNVLLLLSRQPLFIVQLALWWTLARFA